MPNSSLLPIKACKRVSFPALLVGAITISMCHVSLSAQTARIQTGYIAKQKVTSETEMDWVYVLANQSPSKPPKDLLSDYESNAQTFELYVPPRYDPKKKYPLVIFVSPGNRAMGYSSWKKLCENEQIIFAGPHDAGNNCPMPKRVRIVLDVMHQVRSNFNIDPDRTYISGFSGGGRIGCAIGFALPEYFGGVIPICAGGDLRQEDWLRQRVIDRISVAGVTGDTDFNRGEVERYHQQLLEGVGVRSKSWVATQTGHAIPSDKWLREAFEFVETGVDERRKFAAQFPASRADGRTVVSRDEQASVLLKEAKSRLENETTEYSGLMIMKGIAARWPDLDTARQATRVLSSYEQNDDQTWRDADVATQRKFLIARARAVDAYGSGDLHKNYLAQRPEMLRAAIQLWNLVIEDGIDKDAVRLARQRIPELERLLEE